MQLTLRTDYALRTLIYLGLRAGARSTIPEIAKDFRVPRNHLMKVVAHLVRSGYVQAVRGRGGGLRLAQAPSAIRLGVLVRASEPARGVLDCLSLPDQCRIGRCCRLRTVLGAAGEAFLAELDRHTLADLITPAAPLARALGLTPGAARAVPAPL